MRALALVWLAGCQWVFPYQVPLDAGILPGPRTRAITIATPRITAPVNDMQINVLLDGDPDLAAALPDASDIQFFDSSGQLLHHELVQFDRERMLLDAWVLIPNFAPKTNSIVLRYGDQAVHDSEPNMVWQGNFAAVWHFSQSTETDSSPHQRKLSPRQASSAPPIVAGIAGGAKRFATGTSPLVVDGDDFNPEGSSFAVSLWVNVSATLDDFDQPMLRGGTSIGEPGWDFELGSGGWNAYVAGRDDGGTNVIDWISLGPGAQPEMWVQIGLMVDHGSEHLTSYLNGSAFASGSIVSRTVSSTKATTVNGDHPFLGLIDEARIYDSAIDPARFAIEFDNLAGRAQFMVVGPPQLEL